MRLKAAERSCLLLQQFRSQIDLGSINGTRMELLSHVTAIEEAEQLVCRPVVQLLSCIGINVIHHQVNLFLGQEIERGFLRQDPSNHFMRYLTSAFLVRALRITVEDSGPDHAVFVTFNRQRIG